MSQVEKLSKPATEKVMDLNTAIKNFVTDGCYLCWGGFADRASIASVFEIARQGIKDLVITTETDTFMQTSVLMGLGLVKKYEFAYCWGAIWGPDQVFRELQSKASPVPLS